MRTAVFGGTFDPPTLGHLKQLVYLTEAKNRANEYWFDRIRVVVSGDNRPDKKSSTSAAQRLEMLKLLLLNLPSDRDVICDEIEVERGCFIPTVDLLVILGEKYEDEELYFVIGEDQAWRVGENWVDGERLRLQARFCVLARAGYNTIPAELSFEKHHVQNYIKLPADPSAMIDCSSSQCRDLIRAGQNASEFLAPEIIDYINIHGLYR